MKKWIIRKPEMYRAMREASFSPGIAATVLIVFFMLVVNYIVREIPASMIDYAYYASHPADNSREALQIIIYYSTAPSTMFWSLSLTVIMIGIVTLYVKRAEKRPLATIGLSRERFVPRFAVGYLLGIVMMSLNGLWDVALRAPAYTGFQPVALLFIPFYIIQASSEEILFRGYMLSSIMTKTGVIRAVLFTSLLFALLHVGDTQVLVLVQLFFFGALCALLTMRTNSLWAACGLHAAWNFAFGLFFPVVYGQLATSYSMFTVSTDVPIDWGIFGSPVVLPGIALCILLIALVLFAGKNRLVVTQTEGEQMVFRARRIAKSSLRHRRDDFGKPYTRHPMGVVQLLEDDTGRAAVLLADACNVGGIAPDSLTSFNADVMAAVNALLRMGDETDLEYGKRVRANPAALAVWKAQLVFEEKLLIDRTRWDRRRSTSLSQRPDIYFCPMVRRDLHQPECVGIMRLVDDYADDDAHASLRYLDRRICPRCAKRREVAAKSGAPIPQPQAFSASREM